MSNNTTLEYCSKCQSEVKLNEQSLCPNCGHPSESICLNCWVGTSEYLMCNWSAIRGCVMYPIKDLNKGMTIKQKIKCYKKRIHAFNNNHYDDWYKSMFISIIALILSAIALIIQMILPMQGH